MKNLYTKNEFLLHTKDEMLNEGLLGKAFKFLWSNAVKLAKKIKGSGEINKAYDKYKKLIDDAFNKMQNIEGAKMVAGAPPESKEVKPANAGFEHTNDDKLNEAAPTPTPAAPTTPAAATQVQAAAPADKNKTDDTNKQEASNLTNLKPEQIKKLADETTKRIEQLKTQFDTDVNNIITRLSKNADYSSDKLKQFSVVMKNQLNSYLYEQWYSFYTKIGDQKKILEITKIKKENEATYKKSIQELNTTLGEKNQTMQIKTGGQYKYYSDTNKAEITVNVVGKEIGKDEKNKPDAEHATMWKVTNPETNKSFWIAPNAFKSVVPKEIKPKDFKVGPGYVYTDSNGKTSDAEVIEIQDNGVTLKTVQNTNPFTIGIKSLVNLKKKKK
jgi:hypothetical protein